MSARACALESNSALGLWRAASCNPAENNMCLQGRGCNCNIFSCCHLRMRKKTEIIHFYYQKKICNCNICPAAKTCKCNILSCSQIQHARRIRLPSAVLARVSRLRDGSRSSRMSSMVGPWTIYCGDKLCAQRPGELGTAKESQ